MNTDLVRLIKLCQFNQHVCIYTSIIQNGGLGHFHKFNGLSDTLKLAIPKMVLPRPLMHLVYSKHALSLGYKRLAHKWLHKKREIV